MDGGWGLADPYHTIRTITMLKFPRKKGKLMLLHDGHLAKWILIFEECAFIFSFMRALPFQSIKFLWFKRVGNQKSCKTSCSCLLLYTLKRLIEEKWMACVTPYEIFVVKWQM